MGMKRSLKTGEISKNQGVLVCSRRNFATWQDLIYDVRKNENKYHGRLAFCGEKQKISNVKSIFEMDNH